MAGGMQSARGALHFARVFELADACGALADPELASARMKRYLSLACAAASSNPQPRYLGPAPRKNVGPGSAIEAGPTSMRPK
jgi:hypothetical protein